MKAVPKYSGPAPAKLTKRDGSDPLDVAGLAMVSKHAAVAEAVRRHRLAQDVRGRSILNLDHDFRQAADDGAVAAAQEQLTNRIRAHLDRGDLAVTLTDNRYTMISVRRESDDGPFYKVRLHHMFADASPTVTRALARYIARDDAEAATLLGEYIDGHQHRVKVGAARSNRVRIETKGQYHDLQEIFDDLNERYFDGGISARITWGQRSFKKRRRNSIKMGSYSMEDRLIRIHRTLDRAFVPRFFVAWIVYHEMLHQIHGVEIVGGRRTFHSPAFLAQEAEFEHYDLARQWELDHLDALLTF